MSFPKFPTFQKLTVDDKDTYLQYYRTLNEPYSYFSIADLLIWVDFYSDLEVSDLNNNIVIKFTNVLENSSRCYSLIGTSQLKTTLTVLSDYLRTQVDNPKLSYVPEPVAVAIKEMKFPGVTIEEDRDNSDYVYKIDDLIAMEGKSYRNLRERVRNFSRDNKDIHVEMFDLKKTSERNIIQRNILKWSERNNYSHNDPDKFELPIIDHHLQLADLLPVRAYGLYVKKALTSVVIFNIPPQKDWIIVNHVKCDYSYGGVFGRSTYELAVVAQSLGYKWINFQQDLGIEGLRRIKTFLRPANLLRCYTVSFDGEDKYQ